AGGEISRAPILLSDQNLSTFSPRLASLIIESCGLLDSILRQISPDPATVDGQSIPRKQLDIVHYAKLYAARFEIPTSKSILMLTPPRYLTPFSAWVALLSGSGYQPATWWRIHTDLKHDRIANLKKAIWCAPFERERSVTLSSCFWLRVS